MAHFLPNNLAKVIVETVAPLLANHRPYSLLLFGSYARGTQKAASDIDVAVKGPGPLDLATWAKIEMALEESSVAQKIDLVDYHRVSTEFKALLDREAIPL